MNKKLIGIFVCTLLIATAFPVIGMAGDMGVSEVNRAINENFNDIVSTCNYDGDDELDQQQNEDCGYGSGFYGEMWLSQSFTPSLDILTRVQLKLFAWHSPPGDIEITIFIRNNKYGDDLTSSSIDGFQIPGFNEHAWIEFNFSDILVTPGDVYYLVCRADGGTSESHYDWFFDVEDPYEGGLAYYSVDSGSHWYILSSSEFPRRDFCFKTYGISNDPPNTPICKYNKNDNELTINTTDNDGDKVRFGISWGNDRNVDEWTEFINSGTKIVIDCNGKTSSVGAIAEDEHGAQSNWISVMPKNKVINIPFLQLLENRPRMFPLLRQLFGL